MTETSLSLNQHVRQRLISLRDDRRSFWLHWQELGTFILPRRVKWLVTPNQSSRGSPINAAIVDATGTLAARTLASGMMSGITSPTRPWFRLSCDNIPEDETTDGSLWLAECERRMMRVMQESNFYDAMATLFFDLVVFGTGACLINEDYDDVVRCYNPCAGEYYLGVSDRFAVNTFYREFALTIAQCVQWFGRDNCSPNIQMLWDRQGSGLGQEILIGHCIEPRTKLAGDSGPALPWRECYWEIASNEEKFLRIKGYNEIPGIFPRWDLVSNDAYGRSPAMDALGDIKQLQQETRRKAQAIDKMVNPPLVGDIQLKNQPASTLPGGITYVQGVNNVGLKPIYTVAPPIAEMMQDIAEVQQRIRNIFFNDLFLMISQLETVRTATEIDARREEKLVQLGPVLERFNSEGLNPAIDRIFNIMSRAKLLPPPPPELAGQYIKVDYVSMLADAQQAVSTASIDRVLNLAGSLAAADPSVMDNVDLDQTVQEYSSLLRVNKKLLRSDDAIEKIRAERAKAQQQQALLEQTASAVQGAKVLSETKLGGNSALDAITGSPQ